MPTTIRIEGDRAYLCGLPFCNKDEVKFDLAARYDPASKRWYVSAFRSHEAGRFASAINTRMRNFKLLDPKDIEVIGRAEWLDQSYYIFEEQDGEVQLCTLDQKDLFWVACDQVKIIKRYDKPLTLARLQELVAESRRG
jgi:hypothetical protein